MANAASPEEMPKMPPPRLLLEASVKLVHLHAEALARLAACCATFATEFEVKRSATFWTWGEKRERRTC